MREITKYHDTSKTVKERAKNKLFGAVYSHTAIILLLILLQIGIMILTFTYLGNYSTYMNGVMSLLSFITAIYIFNEKGNPAFKMTWILFVFLVPVVGVGFYLFTKQGSEPNIWVPDWRSFEWRLNLICSRMNMSSMR